jgi:riboflavin biosynthesis pyrimidine reductase
MRQLLPAPRHDVDLFDAYRPERPGMVRLDMVASVDGAVTDAAGRSGGLGGSGDSEVFRTLRAHADVILVGAGTARTEGYGPHRLRDDLAARRAAEGRPGPAAIAVVTGSLDLDLTAPLFHAAVTPTIVVTTERADADLRAAAEEVATVLVCGEDAVAADAAIAALRSLGHDQILCEGGPTLNRALLRAGLVDELCLTVAPVLVGVGLQGLAGELGERVELGLRHVLEHEGELYVRYAVASHRPYPDERDIR